MFPAVPLLGRRAMGLAGAATVLAGPARAQELRPVRIGIASSSLPAGVCRLCKEMKLFARHGLDANITAMENGSVATMALLSSSLDFSTGAGSEVVLAQFRKQPVVAVHPLYSGFGAVLVLSRDAAAKTGVSPDAPLAARLKALEGLVIATPAATATSTLVLRPVAKAVGATPRFTYMSFQAMTAALEAGVIQGFIASSPFYAIPIRKSTGMLWINGPKGEFPAENTPASFSVLTTRRDLAVSDPALIARMVAVFTDFAQSVDSDPAAVKAAIAAQFPALDPPTIDLMFDTEAPGFRTRRLSPADMAHELGFVRANGLIPADAALDPAAMLLN